MKRRKSYVYVYVYLVFFHSRFSYKTIAIVLSCVRHDNDDTVGDVGVGIGNGSRGDRCRCHCRCHGLCDRRRFRIVTATDDGFQSFEDEILIGYVMIEIPVGLYDPQTVVRQDRGRGVRSRVFRCQPFDEYRSIAGHSTHQIEPSTVDKGDRVTKIRIVEYRFVDDASESARINSGAIEMKQQRVGELRDDASIAGYDRFVVVVLLGVLDDFVVVVVASIVQISNQIRMQHSLVHALYVG